jgi:hypothetical protein
MLSTPCMRPLVQEVISTTPFLLFKRNRFGTSIELGPKCCASTDDCPQTLLPNVFRQAKIPVCRVDRRQLHGDASHVFHSCSTDHTLPTLGEAPNSRIHTTSISRDVDVDSFAEGSFSWIHSWRVMKSARGSGSCGDTV